MLFNSWPFFYFFAFVYSLYIIINHKAQNRLLLIASYIFYGAWDWRFLLLILFSTGLDYLCGIKIHASSNPKTRKRFLLCSLIGNLGILGVFKYFNFFAQNFQSLMQVFGLHFDLPVLQIILPVGISFYTFQTLSYTIDIYRKQLKPTRNFLDFALYVCFFPQLMAGPIERAKDLIPQITNKRTVTLEKFYEGCYLICWGLFQKVFAADNLGRIADKAFANNDAGGALTLLGVYAFTIQIFCDFAGYSNMARGLAKCMGIELSINFKYPYFSTNPVDYWKRWHITLYSWMRDYVYIPLTFGRKKLSTSVAYQSTIIVMLLGGLWHGAGWSYILWGLYHGILLVAYRVTKPFLDKIKFAKDSLLDKLWFVGRLVVFFQLLSLSKMVFRSESLSHFIQLFQNLIFNFSLQGVPKLILFKFFLFSFIVMIVQFLQYKYKDLMIIYKSHPLIKTIFYTICIYLLILFGVSDEQPFIYFQF